MTAVVAAVLLGLASPVGTVTALPAGQASPPERVELPVVTPGCARTGATADEIVVCGKPGAAQRIDPATLRAIRSKEAGPSDTRLGREKLFAGCGVVGPMASCNTSVVPLIPAALKAVELAVKAVKGEDLRPALKTVPSEYDLVQAAKAEDERKAAEAEGIEDR